MTVFINFIKHLYLPLFFLCAYKFLNLFITVSLVFPPLALFAILFYVFVFIFQKSIYIAVNQPTGISKITIKEGIVLTIFSLLAIGIFIGTWFGAQLMVNLMVAHAGFPRALFVYVGYGLDIFAFILTFALHYFESRVKVDYKAKTL